MIFQSYALWPHMTAFQNVAYPLQGRAAEEEGDRRAGRPRLRARRHPRAAAPVPGPDERRPAAARRPRARARRRRRPRPLRRAALERRREGAGAAAVRAPLDAARARLRCGLRDPRPGGGDGARAPHRRHARRADRAGRAPARDLHGAGEPVRRELRRLVERARGYRQLASRRRRRRRDGPRRGRGRRGGRRGGRRATPLRCAGRSARASPTRSRTSANRWRGEVRAAAFLGANIEHVVRIGEHTFRTWSVDTPILEAGTEVLAVRGAATHVRVLPA